MRFSELPLHTPFNFVGDDKDFMKVGQRTFKDTDEQRYRIKSDERVKPIRGHLPGRTGGSSGYRVQVKVGPVGRAKWYFLRAGSEDDALTSRVEDADLYTSRKFAESQARMYGKRGRVVPA